MVTQKKMNNRKLFASSGSKNVSQPIIVPHQRYNGLTHSTLIYRRRRRKDDNGSTLTSSSYRILTNSRLLHSFRTDVISLQRLSVARVILFLNILILLLGTANAYPSYLLSASQCWTKLAINEVIMNHAVVPYEKSDDHEMHIRAFDKSDGSNTETVPHHIDPTTVMVPAGFPAVISIHVVTTNTKTNPDYQWAMDVVVPEDDDKVENPTSINMKPPAHFVDGSCPNRVRLTGRSDEVVSVTVEKHGAQLIAAWAAGMEAVRLTPILTFVSSASIISNDKNKSTNEQKVEDVEPVDPQKLVDQEIQTTSNERLKDQIKRHKEKLASNKRKDQDGYDDTYLKRQSSKEQEERIRSFSHEDKNVHFTPTAAPDIHQDHGSPLRLEFRNLFHTAKSPSVVDTKQRTGGFGITFSSYVRGCCFFIISIVITIQSCLWVSKRTTGSTKGRRDL